MTIVNVVFGAAVPASAARRMTTTQGTSAGIYVCSFDSATKEGVTERTRAFYLTLLHAFGKRWTYVGKQPARGADHLAALAWAEALELRHLVVLRADKAAPSTLTAIVSIVTVVGADLTIVFDAQPSRTQRAWTDSWIANDPYTRDDLATEPRLATFRQLALAAADPTTGHVTDGENAQTAAPPAPQPDRERAHTTAALIDPLTFYTSIETLHPHDRDLVRVTYLSAVNAAADLLNDHHAQLRQRPLDVAVVAHLLRILLNGAADALTAEIALKAAQLVFSEADIRIRVDRNRFHRRVSATPQSLALNPHIWNKLDVYWLPIRGAACALTTIDLRPLDMCTIPLADINPHGAHVTYRGNTIETPPTTRRFIRAQYNWQLLSHRTQADGLMTASDGTSNPYAVAKHLGRAQRELDVPFSGRYQLRLRETDHTWATRAGLTAEATT